MKIKKGLIILSLVFVATGCNIMGPHTHTFSDTWSFDETHHWHSATCGHDVKNDLVEHVFDQNIENQETLKSAATCTEDAVYYKSCICGAISESKTFTKTNSAMGHNPSQNWSKNQTEHWHICTNKPTEKLDKANHVFDQEVETADALKTPASCSADAVYYKSCVCGAISESETFVKANSKLDHDVSQDWSKNATHHWHACNNCEEQLNKEEHTVDSWTIVTDSSFLSDGVKKGNCAVCGQEVTAPINKVVNTVGDVNDSIEKINNLTSIKMLDGSLIEETKVAYNNLSASDKALVTNYSVLENAFTTWEKQYSMVYDPLINGVPTIDGHATSIGEDSTYGTVLKINVPPTKGTSQFMFNIDSNEYDPNSLLHIFIKTPFEKTSFSSQTLWIGEHNANYLNSLNPEDWTEITGTGKDLSASANNATKLSESITLQRYFNDSPEGLSDEQKNKQNEELSKVYDGDYFMASIIAEKRIDEEGSVLTPLSKDTIELVNTWGGDASTIAAFSDQEHGNGVKLSITAIEGAYEIKINGFNKAKANVFDFIYCYVNAPVAAKYYFSQKSWRNNVMTLNVAPDDANNGAEADGQAQYQAGWQKIMIPTSYLPDASSIYFEIYTPTALGEWIITDFCGGYNDKYVSNAATRTCCLSSLNSNKGKFTGTFSKGTDDKYGSYDEITITDLSECEWGPTIKVSGDSIQSDHQYLRFYVYSPLDCPINMAIYGNGWYSSIFPDGHMFNTCLFPKQWNEVIITTNCYNETDKAYKKFDFASMTILFEDIKKTSGIVLDGLKISSFELLDSYPEDAELDLNYDINDNAMYVLGTSNTSNQQMMGFVLTYNGKVIVVDGGMRNEYRQLKNILTALGGHVDYQIFTHAHKDHVGTFIEMADDPDIEVDTLVYSFSSWDNIKANTPLAEDKVTIGEFAEKVDAFEGNVITCKKGTTIAFDDFVLEFLNDRYEITSDVNEASMCFRVTTPNNSIMFLGDLSQNNAPKLLETYNNDLTKLKANYLQLAHHGQRGGSKELYEAIDPNYAIWCTTVRNYNNWTVNGFNTGALKSADTKEWLSGIDATDVCPFYKTIEIKL